DDTQRIARGRVEEREQPAHLRVADEVEVLERLVLEALVREDAGAVHEAGDGPEGCPRLVEPRAQRALVAHVDGEVPDLGASLTEARELAAHLLGREDAARPRADLGRRDALPGRLRAREEGLLEGAFVLDGRVGGR